MKVYLLKDEDFERLLAMIDRDPQYGAAGGSSQVLSPTEQAAHRTAHGFMNYQIRKWLDSVQK